MPRISHRQMIALIGAKVVATRRLHRTWPDDNTTTPITWEAEDIEPRTGWIVGFRYLQTGLRDPGYTVRNIWSDDGPEYERPFLKQTGCPIPAVQVCFWPTSKPLFVPMDGFRSWQDGDPEPFPYRRWLPDEQYRQILRDTMREEMKDWPREKGRWVKKTGAEVAAK